MRLCEFSFLQPGSKRLRVKNDAQFVNCLVMNTPKLWIVAAQAQSWEEKERSSNRDWSLLRPSSKSCDGPIGRLRSLHQSRGIFSRSLASIYHYLEITFVCLKFAGPETLLQYWILNAFSHDDDKNTWMRGERDPVVIFLLSLSLARWPARVQMTRVNSPYSCGVMRKCDSQTRVLRVMDRFFPIHPYWHLWLWLSERRVRPTDCARTAREREWMRNKKPSAPCWAQNICVCACNSSLWLEIIICVCSPKWANHFSNY